MTFLILIYIYIYTWLLVTAQLHVRWLPAWCIHMLDSQSIFVTFFEVRGKALSQAKLAPNATAALRKALGWWPLRWSQVYHEEGLSALYRGLSMEIMRGMTQSAVMFAVTSSNGVFQETCESSEVMERIRTVVRARLCR